MYPLFLKLTNSKCLVIGGGPIAERKTITLLESGASVTVISPDITLKIQDFVKRNIVTYQKRSFEPNDTQGFFLIIAATNSKTINKMIYNEASDSQRLINSVDDPENCNFYVPAKITRGDLQIAISTSGKLPLLAKKLRNKLGEVLPNSIKGDLNRLYHLRTKILDETKNNPKDKKQRMEKELEAGIDIALNNTGLK